MKYNTLPQQSTIDTTIESLRKNGIDALFVKNGEEAKNKVLELLPKNAEVMTMQSMTLRSIGLFEAIDESGDYDSVRNKLSKMDRATQGREMQKLGAAPQYTVGSVHAVTTDGTVMIASNTGSQLPAYAYGAQKVIWVVGTQKIVQDIDEGIDRIYEYILPLESKRLSKALGKDIQSYVSKLLKINREVHSDRITLIFVNEILGF